jgi:hypothetical protein
MPSHPLVIQMGAGGAEGGAEDDDDVPELVGNFEEADKA